MLTAEFFAARMKVEAARLEDNEVGKCNPMSNRRAYDIRIFDFATRASRRAESRRIYLLKKFAFAQIHFSAASRLIPSWNDGNGDGNGLA